MTESFLCVPCLLKFQTRDQQLQHFKDGTLHHYNLKRTTNGLPPIAPAEFERKMQLLEEAEGQVDLAKQTDKKRDRRHKRHCHSAETLGKRNSKDLEHDILYKKSQPDFSLGEPELEDIPEEDTAEEYRITMSLFSRNDSETFEENLEYMDRMFSLHIPDMEYLKDPKEFVEYLGRKVYEGHQCLYCNQPFKTTWACLQHMSDKGHRRIGTHLEEHKEEYEDFYDYSSSYKECNLPEEARAALDEENWEVVEEWEESEEGSEGEDVVTEIVPVSGPLIRVNRKSQYAESWAEKFERVGFKAPYLTAERTLMIPAAKREAYNRNQLRNGRPILTRPIQSAKKSLAASSYWPKEDRAKVSAKYEAQQKKSNLRLGVKANKLYRYISRKNKVFI